MRCSPIRGYATEIRLESKPYATTNARAHCTNYVLRVLDGAARGYSARNTDDNTVDLGCGFAEFDPTEVADKLLLERPEATAAPEHESRREDQPAEEAGTGWS